MVPLEDIKRPWLRRAAIVAVILASPVLIAFGAAPILYRELVGIIKDTITDVREIW